MGVQLQYKDGVPFNRIHTIGAKAIRRILVYPPFDMIGFFDTNVGRFTQIDCSCGWSFSNYKQPLFVMTPITQCQNPVERQLEHDLIAEAKEHNIYVNSEFSMILGRYKRGQYDYEKALRLLTYHSMREDKAENWLDRHKQGE